MPKYWGKQMFTDGSFPEVGQKQRTKREREKKRANDGNNNSQLRIATPPLVAHAKPPGPILFANFNLSLFTINKMHQTVWEE